MIRDVQLSEAVLAAQFDAVIVGIWNISNKAWDRLPPDNQKIIRRR
jgi:TRAP-type C4-dicarboxylate transport system substrate-binding protein